MQCTCQYGDPPARGLLSDALKISEPLKGGSWEVNRAGFLNHCPALRDQAAVSNPLQDKVNKKMNISVTRRIGSSLCHALETSRGPAKVRGANFCDDLLLGLMQSPTAKLNSPGKDSDAQLHPASAFHIHLEWLLFCLSIWRMLPSMSLLTKLNPTLITSLLPFGK